MLMVDSSVLFTKAIKVSFPTRILTPLRCSNLGCFLGMGVRHEPSSGRPNWFLDQKLSRYLLHPRIWAGVADLHSVGLELCTNRAISMKALINWYYSSSESFSHAIKSDRPEIAILRQSQVAELISQ